MVVYITVVMLALVEEAGRGKKEADEVGSPPSTTMGIEGQRRQGMRTTGSTRTGMIMIAELRMVVRLRTRFHISIRSLDRNGGDGRGPPSYEL